MRLEDIKIKDVLDNEFEDFKNLINDFSRGDLLSLNNFLKLQLNKLVEVFHALKDKEKNEEELDLYYAVIVKVSRLEEKIFYINDLLNKIESNLK